MIVAQQEESVRSRIKKVLGLGQTLICGSIRKTLKEKGLSVGKKPVAHSETVQKPV